MKKQAIYWVLPLLLQFSFFANANNLTCLGKQETINNQINIAEKMNNHHQLTGLKKALDDVTTHCDNDKLKEKYQNKVKEKLAKLKEKQSDLHEAKLKGEASSKISKQEQKVCKAEKELKKAQDQLNDFYQALQQESH